MNLEQRMQQIAASFAQAQRERARKEKRAMIERHIAEAQRRLDNPRISPGRRRYHRRRIAVYVAQLMELA